MVKEMVFRQRNFVCDETSDGKLVFDNGNCLKCYFTVYVTCYSTTLERRYLMFSSGYICLIISLISYA